jgi:hypothetical protein
MAGSAHRRVRVTEITPARMHRRGAFSANRIATRFAALFDALNKLQATVDGLYASSPVRLVV